MPTFTREALYALVWSEPVSKIAPTLGVSDVAVAKACKKVHIPIPPRGYWRQERSGKAPNAEPLPPRGPGASGYVNVGAETDPADPADLPIPPIPAFAESLETMEARVRRLVGRVAVPKDSEKLEAKVTKLLEADKARNAKSDMSWDRPLFASPFERRRLRILSALVSGLARINATLDVRGKDPSLFPVTVGDTRFDVNLDEPNPRERYGYRYQDDLAKPLNTTLVLSVVNRWDQKKQPELSWSDKPGEKLEQQVTQMVVGVIMFAERRRRTQELEHRELKIQRREEEIREHREEMAKAENAALEKLMREEKARVDRLISEAHALRTAHDIRLYVQQVRELTSGDPDSFPGFGDWAWWALAQADRIDPVITKAFLAIGPDGSEAAGSPAVERSPPLGNPEFLAMPSGRPSWLRR